MTREQMKEHLSKLHRTQRKEDFENFKNLIIEDILDCEDMFQIADFMLDYLKQHQAKLEEVFNKVWKDK